MISINYSTIIPAEKKPRAYVNESVRPCSNKTLLIKTG